MVGGGLKTTLSRLDRRIRQRQGEVHSELGLLSRVLLAAREARWEDPPLLQLERQREELRLGLVRFNEQEQSLNQALSTPSAETSLRDALDALPERRLEAIEAELLRLLRRARAQLELVRRELLASPDGLDQILLALPQPRTGTGLTAWLPSDATRVLTNAVRQFHRKRGSPHWQSLVTLLPPPPARFEDAIASSREAHELATRAVACVGRDDQGGAVEYLRRAQALRPLGVSESELLANALLTRSVGRAGAGEYGAAERDATLAIASLPKSAWSWSHRGYCRRRLGNLKGAAEDLIHALELNSPEAGPELVVISEQLAARAWKRNNGGDVDGAVGDWKLAWVIETKTREAQRKHALEAEAARAAALAARRKRAQEAGPTHSAPVSAETHGAETHGAETHGAEAHAPAKHGAETHGAETHGAETHGAETHGAETHGAEAHGAETHGAETHGVETHAPAKDGAETHAPAAGHAAAGH
jgi:tetratricopeptide (TPR) repeat protein